MTNKEVLIQIRDIRRSLSRMEKDSLSEQAEELQSIYEKQAQYQAEVNRLEEQLNHPEGYYVLYSTEDSLEHVNKIESNLRVLAQEQAENEATMKRIRQRIQLIDSETSISAGEMEVGRQEETDYSNIDTEGKSADEIADIQEKIQRTRAAIEDIDAYAKELANEKEELLHSLEPMEKRQESLALLKKRYEDLLPVIQADVEKGQIIDEEKMTKDRDQLKQAQEALKAFNMQAAYLSFSGANALSTLEDYFKTGEMDAETLVDQLKYIQTRVPKLPGDVPEELSQNQSMQQQYVSQIIELEDKLKDDANYTVSAQNFEQLNQDIIALEMRASDYDVRIKENDAIIMHLENNYNAIESTLTSQRQTIQDLQNHIMDLQTQLANPILSKRVRRDLEKQLRDCRKNIDSTNKYIDTLMDDKANIELTLQGLKKSQKQMPKLYDMTEKLLAEKRERLNDKKTIDAYAKRMDEDRLHELTAGLEALQLREEFLVANTQDKLEKLIHNVETKGLTNEPEKKKGIGVVFEKIKNTKVIQKITSSSFKTRMKALLGATILAVTFVGCRAYKSSTKLTKGGLSSKQTTMKDTGKLSNNSNIYQIQIDDEVFEVEETPIVDVAEEVEKEQTIAKKSIDEIVSEVILGKWGNGLERKNNLLEAGYTEEEIQEIQDRINAMYHTSQSSKPVEQAPVVDTPSVSIPDNTPTESVNTQETVVPSKPIDEVVGTPVESPIIEEPTTTITPGPTYTVDGDEDIIKEEFHPIVTPKPDRPQNNTTEINVKKGDTLVIETDKGPVAIDNSDGANYQDLDKDTSLDYTASDAVKGVQYNDTDESVKVTVNTDEVTPSVQEKTAVDQQILSDYEQILRELGLSEHTLEDSGRTR